MPFSAKKSIGERGMSAEIRRLATYVNTHVVALNHIAAIATANGSDPATTQALANATKTTVNSIITALHGVGVASTVATITTPDGSDAGTTQTLANATKAEVNALLAAMVAEGLMAP